MGKCELRDFDCWRLGRFTEVEAKEMEKIVMREYKSNSQSAMSVIEEMRKKEAKREVV